MLGSFGKPRTGVRQEAPANVKGRQIDGASSVINFISSVQPITGHDLAALPEGLREGGKFALYTDFELRTVNQTTKTPADVIDLFGKKYKVVVLEPWGNNVLNHFRAVVSEVDDNA